MKRGRERERERKTERERERERERDVMTSRGALGRPARAPGQCACLRLREPRVLASNFEVVIST